MSLSSLPDAPPRPEYQPPVRRRRRRSRWSRIKHWVRRQRREPSRALLGAVGVVVLLVVLCGWRVASAQQALRDAERAFLEAKDAIAETRTDDAAVALSSAEESLRRARSHATGFPLGLTRPVPLLGSPAEAVVDVAAAGEELVAAGVIINDAAASFPTSGEVGTTGHDLSEFHHAAVASDEALDEARRRIDEANLRIERPAGALLPMVSGPARSAAATIGDARRQLDGARRGLTLMADLTAPTTKARILVLSQDTMEIRPTGGFVGSYGVLEFNGGRVDLTEYAETGDLPEPSPPLDAPPFLATHLADTWALENAMWWPDFPRSAATAVELFRRQGGGDVDGVLALTENTLARIVGAIGPIQVPGYAEPVTEEGFADRVLYEVELKRPLDQPRKRFLIELSEIVLNRLFDLPPSDLAEVVAALRTVDVGDVQAWFVDVERQALVSGTTLSGELPTTAGDFLLVTDANMTASKANRDLTRDVVYQVRRDRNTDELIASLRLTYRNAGADSVVNRYYNGFVRVYAPAGAALRSGADAAFQPIGEEGGREVFGGYVFVRPGEEVDVALEYVLPSTIGAGEYELTWVRQPGAPRDSLLAVLGGRHHRVEASAGSLYASHDFRGDPVREFLHDRWVFRKLGF